VLEGQETVEGLELKHISGPAVPEAVKKAEHYRLLNEPEQAESICLDILEVEPDNEKALVVLVLAMTDQFAGGGAAPAVSEVFEYLERLTDAYQRAYYSGLVLEREARAYLSRGKSGVFAYDRLRDAMDRYEEAAGIRPEGDDSAILRWNACVRTIRREHLKHWTPSEFEAPLE
jgi:tetratricopeptide (TPR) repeat protein